MTTNTDDEDLDERVRELEALVDALQRKMSAIKDDAWQLEEENERVRERVADLEEIVAPDPGSVAFEELSRPRKAYRVRKALVEQAAASANGRAAMNYTDVKWLFDGQPSDGHCYDLMELAADLDGFDYGTPSGEGGQKRVTVNIDAVNDETLVHAVNNARGGVTE